MNLSPIEWKRGAKSLALVAAAVVLPLAVLAPDSADARQDGFAFARSGDDGDRHRLYRRGGASSRSGTTDRDGRTRHNGRDSRTQDDRKARFGGSDGERTDRTRHNGRDYRNRDDRKPRYSRNDRKPRYGRNDRRPRYSRDDPKPQYRRTDRRTQSSRIDRRRSQARYRYDPGRTVRYAYRTPSHRHQLHGGHRRLSESYIRALTLRHYPTILWIEFWDGIYYVWVHDYYGRPYRLAYDAYTGIFLTFIFLGILGLLG